MAVDPGTALVKVAIVGAQMAFTMSRKIEGPRLSDLKVSTAEFGTPIVRGWGVFRVFPPIPWAEDLHETKVESKTKGGKFENYKYDATFAILFCDVQIDAIGKLWMNNKLVMDLRNPGPVSPFFGAMTSSGTFLSLGRNFRLYLGTEDQLPDPRYDAWCAERFGPDSAPAFRGEAYAVIQELPLEPWGNVIPQIKAEVIRVKAAHFPYETRTTAVSGSSATWAFSPSGQWAVRSNSNGKLEWWDIPSRTNIGTSESPGWATGSATTAAVASDGTAYNAGFNLGTGDKEFASTTPLGVPAITVMDAPTISFQTTRVLEYAGIKYVYTIYDTHSGYSLAATHITHTQSLRDACLKSDGTKWGLFQPTGSSSDFSIEDLDTPSNSFTVTGDPRSGPSTAFIQYVDSENHFCVVSDDNLYLIDADDGSIKYSAVFTEVPQFDENNPYATTFWVPASFDEYSFIDGSLIRNLSKSSWVGSPSSDSGYAYERVTNSVWSLQSSSSNIIIRYIDRVDSAEVTLADITAEVAGWEGLVSSDYDVTDLEAIPVKGYSVVMGAGTEMLEPLFDMHDVDPVPHDFQVRFKVRGAATALAMDSSEFVTSGDGDQPKRWSAPIAGDRELPIGVTITYADETIDEQQNSVRFMVDADTVDSQNVKAVDLKTYVSNPTEAQPLADRMGRRLHAEREKPAFSLTIRRAALEPGDMPAFSIDGVDRRLRLTKLTRKGPVIDTEWVRDDPRFHDPNASAGPTMDGREEETIFVPAPSWGTVMDIPYTRDSEAAVNPKLRYAAGSYLTTNWAGAIVWEVDGDQLFAWNIVPTDNEAVWGMATTALADVPSPWLWDRGNTLDVEIRGGGTLANATEAEVDADPTVNQFLLKSGSDWEIGNFTAATLLSSSGGVNSYRLRGFKRGRRGTEWATRGHAASDIFVLTSSLLSEDMGLDDVGKTLDFKVQSVGRVPDSVQPVELVFAANDLKPLAPARIKWTTDGTDMFGEIIRRTRVGGSWTDSGVVPLSENSEAYAVEILDGSGEVLRTIPVTGTSLFTYANADILADGNSVGVPPSFNAYQISDTVGRGFPLAA